METAEPWRSPPLQLRLVILVLAVIFLSHETVRAQSAPTVSVSPKSLIFAAEQGGTDPADQPLNISTTAGRDMTWTVSKTASWLKLTPPTGTTAAPLTVSVATGSLAAETYRDVITLAIDGTATAKIPVTFLVALPHNTNKEEEKGFVIRNFKSMSKDPADGGCIKDLSKEPVATGDFGKYISVGPTVAAQAFNYDLASKRVSFNAGGGAGLAVRVYWPPVNFEGDPINEVRRVSYGINQIRKRCRVESFDPDLFKSDTQKVAPLFSISPMVFASKSERGDDIRVQPVISVGFLGELVNVGAGFNLSGPDKGHVFILLSLGYGFKF